MSQSGSGRTLASSFSTFFEGVCFILVLPVCPVPVHYSSCLCLHLTPCCSVLDLGLLIFEPQAVIINLNLFQAKSNIITDAYLLFWVLKNRSAIKQLLSRANLITKPARGWTVNSCSSFSCLLVSLLPLPVPSRTHGSAPALQTRMDDFTVLPGFPLWPRDLPLPSADISQQQRRTQLSGSLRSCTTAQRARSNTRTRHTHLEKGSDSRHRIYSGAERDFSLCFKPSFDSTHGGQPCLRCCHTARGKWAATGRTARSARCPLAAGCRTQAPFSPPRRRRDHQSWDRSAEPSEVKTRKDGRIRNINAIFTSTY